MGSSYHFDTQLIDDGPRHIVYPDTNGDGLPDAWNLNPAIWLGNVVAGVDYETDGKPNTDATGDDGAFSDDEDGITAHPSWSGTNLVLTVQVTGGSGTLGIWIDWDRNGAFNTAPYVADLRQPAARCIR